MADTQLPDNPLSLAIKLASDWCYSVEIKEPITGEKLIQRAKLVGQIANAIIGEIENAYLFSPGGHK